ncbi:MAG: UDP-N-acetylmuramoyl-tripeptide--D-alanyl-D-alanine ligase [Pelagibacterales bacterium]|nr:UDP-N-acetylmuramoyl-tripeptide--D-alanyl-D-alanine ligase [Pelagibacterales bacterium]
MTLWKKQELLDALKDEVISHNILNEIEIDEVVIDSRKASKTKLFIALKGEKHDAHDFLNQVFENGCEIALIHKEEEFFKFRNSKNHIILVKNTFIALYKLAAFARQRSRAKIIAITGSVGKTGTKEMLKNAFESQGKTYATIGNLNNHIGLPLTLCNFPKNHDFGIFEMGMNHLGEIEPLSELARPHLAIITNVGPVHIENFKSEQEIAIAKSEIFAGLNKNSGKVLINFDNKHYDFLRKKAQYFQIKEENIYCFGEMGGNYQILESIIKDSNLSEIKAKTAKNIKVSYQISTSQKATIFNSVIVLASLDLVGNNIEKGLEKFKEIKSQSGRGKISEIKVDDKKIVLIDDTYNASVLSMKSGIDHALTLKNSLNKKRVIAALGEMLELGEKSLELHEEVTNYLRKLGVDFSILVGKNMTKAAEKLEKNFYKTFDNSSDAALEIKNFLEDGDILYIKGSRGTKMEVLVTTLNHEISKNSH